MAVRPGAIHTIIAKVTHRQDGHDWAVFMNSRPQDNTPLSNGLSQSISGAIDRGLAESSTGLCSDFPSEPQETIPVTKVQTGDNVLP